MGVEGAARSAASPSDNDKVTGYLDVSDRNLGGKITILASILPRR
jgi:hypothetical protein